MSGAQNGETVRWPWLVVSIVGLIGCVVLLGLGRRATHPTAPSLSSPASPPIAPAPPPIAPAPPPIAPAPPVIDEQPPKAKPQDANLETASKRPDGEAAKGNSQSTKPPRRSADGVRKKGNPNGNSRRQLAAAGEKPTAAGSMPPGAAGSAVAAGPLGPPSPAPPPPPPSTPSSPGASQGERGSHAARGQAAHESTGLSTQARKQRKHQAEQERSDSGEDEKIASPIDELSSADRRRDDSIGHSKLGTIGHGAESGKAKGRGKARPTSGKRKDSAPPQTEAQDDDGEAEPQEDADAQAFAKLLPGRFSAKFPERMQLNESAHVRVVLSEKKAEEKAQVVLDSRPLGNGGPTQKVGADVLVGRLLRVELRALPREFEITPFTPAEQKLYPGRVAQWEWVIVPHEEGQHELSLVVTNLVDWSGHPIDITVQSLKISVEITTMQRVRGYASLVSSAVSGVASLVGAWMALLRPFLQRRKKSGESDEKSETDENNRPNKQDEKKDAEKGEKKDETAHAPNQDKVDARAEGNASIEKAESNALEKPKESAKLDDSAQKPAAR